jgi:response regulator RpfG family c-di-GMP phosphodiesterase
MHHLIEYLKKNSLFEGFDEDELSHIAEHFLRTTYKKGETVFKEGDAGQSMFLLIEGEVEVIKNLAGGQRELAKINAGDYFGEMSLLSGQYRIATVYAQTDLICHTISRRDFMALVEKNHRLSLNVIKTLNNRLIKSEITANQQIINAYNTMIFSLAELAESRDPETGEHLKRVQSYCMFLAKQVKDTEKYSSSITDDFIENIYNVSPLHDIGKVGIPDSILLKPGKLTKDEFEVMKTHTTIGAQTMEKVLEQFNHPTFVMAHNLIRHHHERYDGCGYPDALCREDIPLESRIMSISDMFDALISKRCYKEALVIDKTVQIIQEGSGSQFDPDLVKIMMDNIEIFKSIHHRYRDR